MGTIREHREHIPVEMKALRFEKGDAAFYQHKYVVVAKYRAKKNRLNESQRRYLFLAQHMLLPWDIQISEIKMETPSLNQLVSYLTIRMWVELI